MFEPQFRKRVEPLVPRFVLRLIDPFHTLLRRRIAETAATLGPGSMVLDAGAGECPHAALFPNTRYYTLDRGIGDVRWDYSRIGVVGDAHALPFASGTFDAVVNIQVLEHLQEPGVAIQEFARVLKPGGRLILSTVMDWEIHQHPNDFFRFTRYGLAYLFERAGLRVVRIEALGGFFWLLAARIMNLLSFFQKGWRWLLFWPLAPFAGVLAPATLYFLDPLDKKRDYTLGYFTVSERDGG